MERDRPTIPQWFACTTHNGLLPVVDLEKILGLLMDED